MRMDFSFVPGVRSPGGAIRDYPGSPASTSLLSAEEAMSVVVGLHDAFRFGWDARPPRSRLGRWKLMLLAWLIGLRKASPLANERLEMVRLLTCMVCRNDRRVNDMASKLTEMGMTEAAVDEVIARGRTGRKGN